jgi:hypothetical protein
MDGKNKTEPDRYYPEESVFLDFWARLTYLTRPVSGFKFRIKQFGSVFRILSTPNWLLDKKNQKGTSTNF